MNGGGAGRGGGGVDRKKHCTVHLLTPYNHDHEIKNVQVKIKVHSLYLHSVRQQKHLRENS